MAVQIIKKSIKSETMLFSYGLIIFGIIEANLEIIQDFIPDKYDGLAVIGVGIVVALLRVSTTKAVKEL